MLTDSPPRKRNREKFLESDRITTLDLPQDGKLVEIAHSIELAMADGNTTLVRKRCEELLAELSEFYGVPDCGLRVLAARPLRVRERWTSELFGDYSPDTMLIRVWMPHGGAEGSHVVWHVSEHALPRILPSPGFR